ncbi:MAG: tetratricopeptide repeat protein [Bacteroidota bacterium]
MTVSRKELLLQMLAKEPGDTFLNYALALELEKEHKISEAIRVIEKVLEDNADYLGAYYKLGKLYEASGERELARKTYISGLAVARRQKNGKTLSELNEALLLLDE